MHRRYRILLLLWLAMLAVLSGGSHCAWAADVPSNSGQQPAQLARAGRVSPLEHRITLLSKALALDPQQQRQMRSILEDEREAVQRVLRNPNLPPTERVPAMKAVTQRTEDRIREMLSEEQRRNYFTARPVPGADQHPDVQHWLDVARTKQAR